MVNKLPINLLDLLLQRTVEGERIEYKRGWNPDSVMRTLCAFANDFENLGGGYVVIGLECDGNGLPKFPPSGLAEEQLDQIQRELLSYCQQLRPRYFPVMTIEVIEGRNIMVLWAPGGQNRPYKAPASVTAKYKTWHYYVRRYSNTVEVKGETEQELLSLTAKVPFDDRFAQSVQIEQLSRTLMHSLLSEIGSTLAKECAGLTLEALGRQMNVVDGPPESPWPKNVGLLFFNDAPDRFFPGTQIDVLWFPDGAGGDRFDEKTFSGPLSLMTRAALNYIQRNYLHETVVKHPQRPEAQRFWNFPFAAIEEAVVNAVYHRSYEEREPIEVRISPDEIVVLSFPGPDRSIRLEELQSGCAVSRRYRNRRIGEFLKELDLAEGRATGIPKMIKVMAANGSPAPIFETDDERTAFVVRLPRHPQAVDAVTAGVNVVVSAEIAELLQIIKGEMSRHEMQTAMGLKHAEYFRKAYVLPAIEAGCIEMTFPDEPNSRLQRYRLTKLGQQRLSARSP
jgi:ATP-dependent DNA helicase RecG